MKVALAGNPNSGKTTIFNALTGLRQRVANYPGITVERKSGSMQVLGDQGPAVADLIDLPGTYSLVPTSPDERVAMEVLRGIRADTPTPDVVIAVVDAANLERNLYLVSQLIELGRPLVVALTMTDVALQRGTRVDHQVLAAQLGCAVIPVVASQNQGLEALRRAVPLARVPTPAERPGHARLDAAAASLAQALACATDSARRLLIEDPAADIAQFAQRAETIAARQALTDVDPLRADIEARYAWVERIVARCRQVGPSRSLLSERLDAMLLHPVWGLAIFTVIMASLFVSIFWLAAPLQDAVKDGIDWLRVQAGDNMSNGLLRDLVHDGVLPGIGAVIVFVPQIALLFLFLAVLEDSGYLARAAFMMDRLLCRIGLHGKSFIPLLSSFACAIPGILAARTIEGRRERLWTIMVAPFMSCSARLPVYFLIVSAFFADWGWMAKGGLVLGCYALGIMAAVVSAWAAQLIAGRRSASSFMLELPIYHRPHIRQVAHVMWGGVRAFLTRAGTIIFCLSVLLWALATFPRPSESAVVASTATFERTWKPAHPEANPEEQAGALANHLAAEALANS
ncbi:MAG: ferrous iron transport protein B, partial [Planctomycetota bacterium]